jgi:hypothetical protein
MVEPFRAGSGRRAQDPDCCVSYAGRDHQARNLSALRRLTLSTHLARAPTNARCASRKKERERYRNFL